MRIKRAGGLVQDQNAWILENDTRNGYALFLATGELIAALTDNGIIAIVQFHDSIMDSRCLCRRDHLLLRRIFARVEQVFTNRGMEEVGFLRHNTDKFTSGVQ